MASKKGCGCGGKKESSSSEKDSSSTATCKKPTALMQMKTDQMPAPVELTFKAAVPAKQPCLVTEKQECKTNKKISMNIEDKAGRASRNLYSEKK